MSRKASQKQRRLFRALFPDSLALGEWGHDPIARMELIGKIEEHVLSGDKASVTKLAQHVRFRAELPKLFELFFGTLAMLRARDLMTDVDRQNKNKVRAYWAREFIKRYKHEVHGDAKS